MKIIYLFIFISISQVACSHKNENIRIIKECSSEGKTHKCQELCFKDSSLIWELNYSYTGWQIIDSIYYNLEDSVNYAEVYFATYEEDSDSTSVPHYEFRYFNKNQNNYLKSKPFSKIADAYFLTRSYLKDLKMLLELKPIKDSAGFLFEKPVIPSILTQYGIPYNEQLSSFSFELNDSGSLILKDSFTFDNYIVKRNYSYQNDVLEKVVITITKRKNGQIKEYIEVFKL